MTVVPVLGMHRSGTSMFTRALNLMGLELGEPLMASQPDNPKGFWENEFFYNVDVRLLHGLGRHVSGYGRAVDLLQIPALAARIERTAENLDAIEAYVGAQFRGPVWGWKDPRAVLLFPFWLGVLVELGFRQVRPTVITRHPFAVARSMAGRTDLSGLAAALGCGAEELALEMWTAYSHVLLEIAAQTGCYVSAHEWFLDGEGARSELARCRHYLGLPSGKAGVAAALEWLDPGAVHHQKPEPIPSAPAQEALVLYEDLLARARAQRAAFADAQDRWPDAPP